MHARVRQLTTWSLIALYGAISLAAQGLHAIPGCDHSHLHSNALANAHAPCSHSHSGCDGHHHHKSTDAADSSEQQPKGPVDPFSGEEDGCSICQFYAMGQRISAFVLMPVDLRVEPQPMPRFINLVPRRVARANLSRGPPLHATQVS